MPNVMMKAEDLLQLTDGQRTTLRLEPRAQGHLSIILSQWKHSPNTPKLHSVDFMLPSTADGRKQAEQLEQTLRVWRGDTPPKKAEVGSNEKVPRPFKTGDLVQLKSGGPLMTVEAVRSDTSGVERVWCIWFSAKGNPRYQNFLPAVLKSGAP